MATVVSFKLADLKAAGDRVILNSTEHTILDGVVTMSEEEYEVLSVTMGTYGRRRPRATVSQG
jgi:hypothetical protein